MKSIIGEELEAYVEAHTSPRPPLFDELKKDTLAKTKHPWMQVGRVEGTLLSLLVRLSRARRIIEIGTFTGYSALSMAEALPEDGKIITCDRDPEATTIAREYFAKSPHGKKIELRLGDALETIRSLAPDETFDLAFLDADKLRYLDYYEALLPKIVSGGLIVADNTLWSGQVLSPTTADDRGICAYNDHVTADPRVENVLLAVRDGIMVARKL